MVMPQKAKNATRTRQNRARLDLLGTFKFITPEHKINSLIAGTRPDALYASARLWR